MPAKTLNRWQRAAPGVLVVGVLLASAGLARPFENAMDLWMFARISLLARLWLLFHDVPDTYAIKSCGELSTAFESNVPVLFKRCFPAELTSWDFAFLPNSTSMFPECDGEPTRVETASCSEKTLVQKMNQFWADSSGYTGKHVYMMDAGELAHVAQGLEAKGVIPTGFKFRGSAATMTHLFVHGFSMVSYLHSHPDRTFSFGMGNRSWQVINAKHHTKFASEWAASGAVQVTRELVEAPRVKIVQEKGDVLVVPPWWIHRKEPLDSSNAKVVNFNLHIVAEGQLVGEAVRLLQRLGLWGLLS